jgi:hypothetical protein
MMRVFTDMAMFKQDLIYRALQEPIAFWGGVFAGVLRLNVNEDPLKTWIQRTGGMVRGKSGGMHGYVLLCLLAARG